MCFRDDPLAQSHLRCTQSFSEWRPKKIFGKDKKIEKKFVFTCIYKKIWHPTGPLLELLMCDFFFTVTQSEKKRKSNLSRFVQDASGVLLLGVQVQI
jgi:hypothetical protein